MGDFFGDAAGKGGELAVVFLSRQDTLMDFFRDSHIRGPVGKHRISICIQVFGALTGNDLAAKEANIRDCY
jgi:hypothetical protein